MDETRPEFWDERYAARRMSWDCAGVPRDAQAFIAHEPPGRVVIPGCGSGYDVAAFAAAGWDVTGVEFSAAAIEYARSVVGAAADRIRRDDFFTAELGGPFDVVYERAFLCALPPDRWEDYATRVQQLLRGGGRWVGYFFYGEDDEPPPYPLTPQRARDLLGRQFALEEDRAVSDSLPVYAGGERWQIWRKRGAA